MKTIFITSFHPLISRNILLPIWQYLMAEDNGRTVLFVPQKKITYFSQAFQSDKVILEGINVELSLSERFLRYFSLAALDTATLKIKRKTEMRGSGSILSRLIAGRILNQKFLRGMSSLLTPAEGLKILFDKYRPHLVFATDIQNESDLRLLHFAKKRGIKTAAMIRSWDNPTSKGLLRFVPDVLLVQNEIIKKELEEFHGVPGEKIFAIGIPHYDFYFEPLGASRKKFFEELGGDDSKKTVLYAPIGDRYIERNTLDKEIVEILDQSLPHGVQILVRLPPTDTVSELENRGREGRIIFDRPANPFKTPKKAEISHEAEEHFKASVYYSDLIVCGPSTIAVDAVFFEKPVVLVAFDGKDERTYEESVRRYYDYNHWQPILKSGGVRIAKNIHEFEAQVNEYLANQKLDSEGRKRIVESQVYFTDGKSAKRLYDFLISNI